MVMEKSPARRSRLHYSLASFLAGLIAGQGRTRVLVNAATTPPHVSRKRRNL
jgi:hypothetical protein